MFVKIKSNYFSLILFILMMASCGGGGDSTRAAAVPGAPRALETSAGDGTVSLGWDAPLNDGGASIQGYIVNVSPTVDSANIKVFGKSAIVKGLSNGIIYTFSIAARNTAGQGQASTPVQAVFAAANISDYSAITISGDTSQSGIFDPSVVQVSATEVWMAYSGVDYYKNPPVTGPLVQDVSIKNCTQ